MKLKGQALFFGIITVFLLTAVVGCKKSSESQDPTGSLLSHTQCKQFYAKGQESQAVAVENTSCISYQYDGNGTLKLTHINAGFNCCPGALSATIDFSGSTIIISESEQDAACHCLCLYDIDFEILNLEPGQYTFRLVEPYRDPSDEPLEFTVQLNGAATGEYCVDRNIYPWGE